MVGARFDSYHPHQPFQRDPQIEFTEDARRSLKTREFAGMRGDKEPTGHRERIKVTSARRKAALSPRQKYKNNAGHNGGYQPNGTGVVK